MSDAAAAAYVSEHFNFNTNTMPLGTCVCDGPNNVVYAVLKDHKIQVQCPALEARHIARKHTWPEVTLVEALHQLGGGKKKPTKGLISAFMSTFYSARQLIAYTPPAGTELINIPMPGPPSVSDNDSTAPTTAIATMALIPAPAGSTSQATPEGTTPVHQVYVLRNEGGRREIPFFNATHFTGEMLRAGTVDACLILAALRSRDRARITSTITHAVTRLMPEGFRNTLTGNVLDFTARFLYDTVLPPSVDAPFPSSQETRPDRNLTWTPPSRDSVAAKILFQKRLKESIT